MEVIKIKKSYEKELKILEQNIIDYESSGNQELILGSKTLKDKADKLKVVIAALGTYDENKKLRKQNSKLLSIIDRMHPWDTNPSRRDPCVFCGEPSHTDDCEYMNVFREREDNQ